ncbi:MAG: EamA family transporter [Okeania sp. SIO3I5]|uniref:EamA family transporter n=1 Tax=Okeania sp. SIO3I5 TaxID=2607805 RepID=UPI0013BBB30C|nr:DMT family transporter [Okeania sp. SIO3I5]NEQ37751.1 EamA family transporter [Okeania sp. SIO3I5]
MPWLFLATSVAFLQSVKDVYNKTQLKSFDEYIIGCSLTFFTALFLSPLLFLIDIPQLGNNFWFPLFISSSLNGICYIFYFKAIKISNLSVVAPISTLSPLFLLITSPLILQEFPQPLGIIGLLFIVVGSYLFNLKEKQKGYLAPFRAIIIDRGSRLALLDAFLWSISTNFDKIGIQNSSPIFWGISLFFTVSIMLLPIALYKSHQNLYKLKTGGWKLIIYGIINSVAMGCQMIAINLTFVAYVISVKRTSALFSIVLGKIILKEKGFRERLLGAAIMVSGLFLITISQLEFGKI